MSIIRVDESGAVNLVRMNRLLAGVRGGAFKAVKGALNRAGSTAKTRAGQFAASEYTITKSTFMKNVDVQTSVSGNLENSLDSVSINIRYAGNVLPILAFNTNINRSGMIQTKIKRNSGSATLAHAFAARAFGPVAVFERVGTHRFPLEKKFGPSTAHMMRNERVIELMKDTIISTYERRIEVEINRLLNGWGGRS